VVPEQLPADVPAFTGRVPELTTLDTLRPSGAAAVVISAVSGTAGVGKTAPSDSGRARTYTALSNLSAKLGDYPEALLHAERALGVYVANGNRAGQGIALNAIAWYQAHIGDLVRARSRCEQAIALLREADDRHGEAAAWDTLGYVHHRLGQHAQALDCYRRALDHASQSGHRYHQALALNHIADTQRESGDVDAARSTWRTALDILVDLNHPDAASVRTKLDSVDKDSQASAATSGK
jgi:tetratricopeptide (TPR) repeat protein